MMADDFSRNPLRVRVMKSWGSFPAAMFVRFTVYVHGIEQFMLLLLSLRSRSQRTRMFVTWAATSLSPRCDQRLPGDAVPSTYTQAES